MSKSIASRENRLSVTVTMPHFVSSKNEIVKNMNDISSDFSCLKVSALEKASRISGEIDKITIGPDSVTNNECDKSENIENEQNCCNIKHSRRSINSESNKISTQSGITFSMKKILLESELQRREEVRKEIERHWQHMKENGKAIQEHMAVSRWYMARERERKSAENFAYILAEERIAEQEEIQRRREQQREVEEYRKRMKEKEELNKKITGLRTEFELKYSDIVTKYCNLSAISKGCKDKNDIVVVLSSYAAKLTELCQQMEVVDEKIRSGELVPADLTVTEIMLQRMDEMLCSLRSEIERVNAQLEANAVYAQNAKEPPEQTETIVHPEPEITQNVCEVVTPDQTNIVTTTISKEVKHQQEEVEKEVETLEAVDSPVVPQATPETAAVPEEIAPPAQQSDDSLYEYVDKESLCIHINSQQLLENYVKSYNDFIQSASTKKFRFECQKAINIPVNAISGINEQHLRDKYERLHNLLIGKSSPNVGQYQQGAAFCKNILAKKIVSQGETLVSSKPKMAFPIAAIIVALWNDHSDFGDLLLAHFHNDCPFTVPVFMPKLEGQSNEEYYKSMGYKYAEDGTVEKHDKYLKRMSGLMRLYASITITAQRRGVAKTHPHGLQHAWRWLAAVLNIEPRVDVTDLCATLILDILEVTGSALWFAYPKQFHKLLILLAEEYFPRMQSVGSIGGGPLVRLEEFLKNSLTKGSIPPPDGQLPPNFW